MMHSNACNCSSSQTTDLFFWNALETRNILGTTSCCDRWHDVDSSRETVSTLALINSLISLQSSLSEILDDGLQLGEVLLHGTAEIDQLEGALHFPIQHFPLLCRENLVAGQVDHLLDLIVDISKPPQTINGRGG
ncbi:Os08g0551432 [Oryza sativa Japonica Group]|uniref:Os08g0551432 protein n=1 Tax=Oryza sativa subsp. japonica TaxID=39947 RepID=A0A0N7KQ95_ORYSJ|nr:hypothetical protein EE612_045806 [Oryza sativa]BAT06594.1 Os08g0551432 [Oryza sativa Japonica Group]